MLLLSFKRRECEVDWDVYVGNKMVARLLVDPNRYIKTVALFSTASPREQLSVLRFVSFHLFDYLYSSKSSFYQLDLERKGIFDRDVLITTLKDYEVDVIVMSHSQEEAIQSLSTGIEIPVEISIIKQNPDSITLHMKVKPPYGFTFWKHVLLSEYFEADVIPPYHPARKIQWPFCIIEGQSDYVKGGDHPTLMRVTSPLESRAFSDNHRRSWDYINHPFYAKGYQITMEVDAHYFLSEAGIADVLKFLRIALGLDQDNYIIVSSGFNPPIRDPQSQLSALGLDKTETAAICKKATSLENVAPNIWAYRDLTQEGVIDQSFVPSWLDQEGWLDYYSPASSD